MTETRQPTRTARGIRDLARSMGLECPDYIEIHRTYAGFRQRSCGAWSWFAVDGNNRQLFGSQWNCRQLLRAQEVSAGLSMSEFAELDVEKP